MSGTDPASPWLTAAAGSVPVVLDDRACLRHRCDRLIFAAKFLHRSEVGSAALLGE
jgi:hypothetical protein